MVKKCHGCGRIPTKIFTTLDNILHTYCEKCGLLVQPYDEIADTHAFCLHCDAFFHIRELWDGASRGDAVVCPRCGEEL